MLAFEHSFGVRQVAPQQSAGWPEEPKETTIPSPIAKRSIVVAGHKTSVSLENEFWSALKEIARVQGATISNIVGDIDIRRNEGNLSSAIRLFLFDHYRAQTPAVSAIQARTTMSMTSDV